MKEIYTPKYYILDENKNVVLAKDVHEWGAFFEKRDRIVKQEKVGEVRISTVFLGIDHGFLDDGAPLVFETMVFGGEHDDLTERYHTWAEAEEGHKATVMMVAKT